MLYRIHRYIFISQEDEEENKNVDDIKEWFHRIVKLILTFENDAFSIFKNIWNSFMSKKDRVNFKVIKHVPSSELIYLS